MIPYWLKAVVSLLAHQNIMASFWRACQLARYSAGMKFFMLVNARQSPGIPMQEQHS